MPWTSRRAGRAVRLSLAAPRRDAAEPASHDLAVALEDIEFHGTRGYLARHLDGVATTAVAATVHERQVEWAARCLALRADLAVLSRALGDAAVPWVVVKGPVLAWPLHGDPALRPFRDLDVVVPREHLAAARGAIEEAGGMSLGDHRAALAAGDGEVPMRLPARTVLDLHWHLVNKQRVRASLDVPMPALFERRRTVAIEGLAVPTLDAEDTLVHVCTHAVLSGGRRLIWLKDVERCLAVDRPDLEVVRQRAAAWRVGHLVGAALLLSRVVLDVPVPDRLVRSLLPSAAWRSLVATVARGVPRGASPGWPGRHIVAATRPTLQASAVDLARRVGSMGRHPRQLRSSWDPEATLDP